MRTSITLLLFLLCAHAAYCQAPVPPGPPNPLSPPPKGEAPPSPPSSESFNQGTREVLIAAAEGVDTNLLERVRGAINNFGKYATRTGAPVPRAVNLTDASAQMQRLSDEKDFGTIVLFACDPGEARHAVVTNRTLAINLNALATADQEVFARRVERQAMRGLAAFAGLSMCPNARCCLHPYRDFKVLDSIGRNFCPPCTLRGFRLADAQGAKLRVPEIMFKGGNPATLMPPLNPGGGLVPLVLPERTGQPVKLRKPPKTKPGKPLPRPTKLKPAVPRPAPGPAREALPNGSRPPAEGLLPRPGGTKPRTPLQALPAESSK